MKTGNLLFSAVQFVFAALVVLLGGLFIGLEYAPHLRYYIADFFQLTPHFSLIGYLVLKGRGEFIRQHTLEELNFQISLAIYLAAVVVISIPTFGIGGILGLPLGIAAIVLMIIAAVKANAGDFYRYPLIFRFVK